MAIDRTKISRLAENHMALGRVDRAIEEFLKLIEDRSDDFNLLNRVGDAYLQAGKIPEALDLFKKAGSGFERGGFNAKATAVFKKAHRIAADDVEISERLAELYRQTNMIKEAIQIHIEVAEVCTRKGLIKRALEALAKVVDLDPKNLKNKVKLADLYNKEGMKDRAANIYLEVAEALAMDQMHSEANQILERAKTMVTTPQVFLTQSRLCVIQKDLAGAAEHLREGLEVNQRSPELLDALAEVELQSRSPERALEALAQVPQLPQKSLLLCERALRDLVRAQRVEEGLRLFKPIGRDFARRGIGEAAAKTLRTALQGALTGEAWLQLGEIAHQGGNRDEEVECLRHAFADASAANDQTLVAFTTSKLQGLGVRQEDLLAPFAPAVTPPPLPPLEHEAPAPSQETEQDIIRRMQIQKLQREAAHFMQNRYMDSALECYNKILELEPANNEVITAIAEILRASGMLTKVQMHYVKTAEKLAPLGFRDLAVELLDRAEAMFPGSTRLYRRTLGLVDGPAAFVPPPVPAAIPMPAPLENLPLIPLDLEPRKWNREPKDASPKPPEPPPEPPVQAPRLERPPEFQEHTEYEWTEFSEALKRQQEAGPGLLLPPEPGLPTQDSPEPLTLPADSWLPPPEPLTLPADSWLPPSEPLTLPADSWLPQAEPLTLPVEPWSPPVEPLALPVEPLAPTAESWSPADEPWSPPGDSWSPPDDLAEELGSTLSDIDFQLDYGSPEEAMIEIENALGLYPDHPELQRRKELAEDALRRMGHDVHAEALQSGDFSPSFFDLTDVLGDALLDSGDGEEMHDATNVVEKIQSVDELFNAFREGVEQQVKVDDYDTHYNLGIAYKEMVLLDPAIEEFKTAMRDPERTLECCSMLAICEQTQGNLDAAIQWLHKGIDAPGFPPEDAIGLRYDLGNLLRVQDRKFEAKEQFQLVYGQDPDYRDVARLLGA